MIGALLRLSLLPLTVFATISSCARRLLARWVTAGHALVEYNRAVAMRPQVRDLVARNVFELFTTTDQLLSALRAVVEKSFQLS
jgi:hypothetical protein